MGGWPKFYEWEVDVCTITKHLHNTSSQYQDMYMVKVGHHAALAGGVCVCVCVHVHVWKCPEGSKFTGSHPYETKLYLSNQSS